MQWNNSIFVRATASIHTEQKLHFALISQYNNRVHYIHFTLFFKYIFDMRLFVCNIYKYILNILHTNIFKSCLFFQSCPHTPTCSLMQT